MANNGKQWKKIPASARFILRGEFSAPDDLPAGCIYKCDDLPAGCIYKCDGSITLSDSIPLDCEFGLMQFTDCFGDEHLIASHYRIKSDLLQIYDTEVFDV